MLSLTDNSWEYQNIALWAMKFVLLMLQKRQYGEEETDKLTAKLDQDYAKWMKDLEKQNEKITRKVRDELIQKADEVSLQSTEIS